MSYIGAQPQTAEFYYDVFNGDGTTDTFITTISPGTPVSVIVIVNDTILDPEDYYFNGNQIVFVTAPGAGTRNIQLRYLSVPVSGQAAPMTYRNVNEYYAVAGQTTFQTSYYDLNWIDVYVNGTQLGNDDFQALDGRTVILQNACNNQDLVRIVSAYTTVLARARDADTPFAWAKANAANVLAQAAFAYANTIGSGSAIDQTARNLANTASNNITIIQGVNTTQNTNITAVDTYATGAYGKANAANVLAQAAFAYANTIAGGGTAIDQAARNTANTASNNITIIQGVDVGQNTRMTIIEAVDTAQNTRMSIIEGVNATQNTNTTAADTKAQAAFDKANTTITTSGGSITGSLSVSQDLTVSGNLIVLGNTTTISTSTLEVNDTLIYLGANNYYSDTVDIGIIGHYNPGSSNAHTGLIRDPSLKEWIFFQGYIPEIEGNNLINISDASFAYANVYANYFKGNLITRGVDIYNYTQAAFNSANTNATLQAGINATQNTNITAADAYATGAYAKANAANVLAQAAFTYANTIIGAGTAIDQYARNTANTAATNITLLQGVNTTQNTNTTAADTKAQAAFDTANASVSLQSGINATQNTNITNASNAATAGFAAANTKVSSITGTSNQVIVSGTTTPTLSLPQAIATGSSVQFGSLGVGTAASGTGGEIRATNNITAYYSDDRLKTRLGTIENALEKVKSLTGFYYEANQTAQDLGYTVKREIGLSAQEVQNVLPEIVVPAPIDEKYLTIYYEKVIPLLVEAIKDLSKEIDNLKAR